MSIDIQWKHVIVGFFNERNKKCTSLNTLISYVAYKIYKYKMYCRQESLKETDIGIQNHMKESLYGYSKVVKRLNTLIDYTLFNRIAQILYMIQYYQKYCSYYVIYIMLKNTLSIFNISVYFFIYRSPTQ